MRRLLFFSLLVLTLIFLKSNFHHYQTNIYAATKEVDAIIIEVDGNPKQYKKYVETYHPLIEVVAIYEQLFNGLALRATPQQLAKVGSLEFVTSIHPVQTYTIPSKQFNWLPNVMDKFSHQMVEQTNNWVDFIHKNPNLALHRRNLNDLNNENAVIPSELNTTTYTGKGIKIGVIDTGIDYTHPDLKINYKGGYDVVDLDDDPMETKHNEGIPTLHGTHVAGIIAANGSLNGVAPDAELFAYRALGPGGVGTSIQVIAAMEQAVKDGVDIINMSLGNTVNGPDYPTSVAVNKATELGVAVVIANGNSGPNTWTVGAPATALQAFSVGALANERHLPYLYEPTSQKKIAMTPMHGSVPWKLTKDYRIERLSETLEKQIYGKIAIVERGEVPFYELAKQAEEKGAVAVLIYNNEDDFFHGSIHHPDFQIQIPVASISKQDGEWLLNFSQKGFPYITTSFQKVAQGVASFSSRGPVTVNWNIKPDILAPGTNIVSTVPGGYQLLQGTSMAAPHIAGVIALLKEAHPNWSNEKIIGALKTTAQKIEQEKTVAPIAQGAGMVNVQKAIDTSTIIYNPLLSFGKLSQRNNISTIELKIENTSNHAQTYSFIIPKKQLGIQWHLPTSFTLQKNEKKTIPIKLSILPHLVKKGMYQGWLTLNQKNESYDLPFLFIHETTDYPKAAGLEFSLNPLTEDKYTYRLYLTEEAKTVQVNLYDPDTLVYQRTLLKLNNLKIGVNEGELTQKELGVAGHYKMIVTIQLKNGKFENYEMDLELFHEHKSKSGPESYP